MAEAATEHEPMSQSDASFDEEDHAIIKLKSLEGAPFTITMKAARLSGLLRTMIDDLGIAPGDDEAIPLPAVDALVLKKIITWCNQHYHDAPVKEGDLGLHGDDGRLTEWDKAYFNVNEIMLFDILMAANYLDIERLLNQACKTVANRIASAKIRCPEDLRKMFNIKNDFTSEEEADIKKQFSWCDRKSMFNP